METAGNGASGGDESAHLADHFIAFVSDVATERMVRQCVVDLGLTQASVLHGTIDTAIVALAKAHSRALLVDISGMDQPVAKLHELAEVCEPGTSVLVIGDRNDVSLYRNLLNTGVSDYLVKPCSRSLMQSSIAGLLGLSRSASEKNAAHVIAVAGTRGGVGASTVTVNLAVALAMRRSVRVALVDLDLLHGSCDLLLGTTANNGLIEALSHPERLDERFLSRAAIACDSGVSLFASHSKMELVSKIGSHAFPALLGQLRRQFDFVVIDAGCADLTPLQAAVELAKIRILIIDQTMLALRDLLDQREVFKTHYDDQRNFVVVNRFGELGKEGLAIKDIEQTLGQTIDALIPFDAKNVVGSANAGLPIVKSGGPVAKAVLSIAADLAGEPATSTPAAKPWWKFFGQ